MYLSFFCTMSIQIDFESIYSINKSLFKPVPQNKSSENIKSGPSSVLSINGKGSRGGLNKGHPRRTVAATRATKKVGKGWNHLSY